MTVGLTYDLKSDYLKNGYSHEEVAEFDSDETIDSIESTLQSLGYFTELVGNIINLTHALANGKRWDMVFNIAEGLHGIGREAQVPAILDAFQIPYVFSDPLVLALTLHKGQAKRVVRDCGVPTADFAVITSLSEVEKIALPFPLFVKPAAEGTGKGINGQSKINSKEVLYATTARLLEEYRQPILVETYLPGREFTVGIVGTGDKARCLGVMEIVISNRAKDGTYSLHTKENWKGIVDYYMATGEIESLCAETALMAWNCLGCRDGGRVDLKMDASGKPNFIEVNPLAGLNPFHSDFPMLAQKNGIDFTMLIQLIMDSAMERFNHTA